MVGMRVDGGEEMRGSRMRGMRGGRIRGDGEASGEWG